MLVCTNVFPMCIKSIRPMVKTKEGAKGAAKPFHIVVNSIARVLFPQKDDKTGMGHGGGTWHQ